MSTIKQPDTLKTVASDNCNLTNSKMDVHNGVLNENDKNLILSSSQVNDPARKKMFKITSVKKGGSVNGDAGTDNDADSIDGLDESQTDDFSSEFYDSSKTTDLDMDLQDYLNIPLTPDEGTSTTTIVVKQKPDNNSQSRFKVVKIETKEPFRRGKWVCYDFYDTAHASIVTIERNDQKMNEDNGINSGMTGGQNAVHCVQDVHDSSSNIFIPPVVPFIGEGHTLHSDVFVPIHPAPANQILNQLNGLSSDVMAPFIAQQVLMSVASVPSSSTSFQTVQQPGHTTIIQSLPPTNIFPYSQIVPPVSLFQNGAAVVPSSAVVNVLPDPVLGIVGSTTPNIMITGTPATGSNSIVNSQVFPLGGVVAPTTCSLSHIHTGGDTAASQGIPIIAETGLTPIGISHPPHVKTETTAGHDVTDQVGPIMTESTDSIETLRGDTEVHESSSLKEAMEAVGDMYKGLGPTEGDPGEGLASPFGSCLTPVRSLCSPPVPWPFLEYYGPLHSMSLVFPVSIASSACPPFLPHSYYPKEPFYYAPASTSFSGSYSLPPPDYYLPTSQPLLYSSGSAFVPQGFFRTDIPGAIPVPTTKSS